MLFPDRTTGVVARRWWASTAMVAFMVGAAVEWRIHPPEVAVFAVVLTGAGASVVVAALRRRTGTALAAVLLLAMAGVIRGGMATARPDPFQPFLGQPVTLAGTLSATGSPGAVVDITTVTTAAGAEPVSGRVLLGGRPPAGLVIGDRLTIAVSALHLPSSRPGARSLESLERDGVDVIGTVATPSAVAVTGVTWSPQRVLAIVRDRVRTAVDADLPEPEATLVLGIGMGIHQPVDAQVRSVLQDAGLYHVVAVSGLKVIIVLGLLDALLGAAGVGGSRRRAAGLCGVALYVVVSGSGAAALRSALMASLAFAVRRDGRRLDPLMGLVCIAVFLCAIEPPIVFDVGFQLSFAGTAGILFIASWLQRRLPGPRLFVDPLAVTVAAQLATVPIMAQTFGVISLVGPLANAILLPALPLMVALGVVGGVAGVVSPVIAWLPLHIAGTLSAVIVGLASVLTALPGSAIHVVRWPAAWAIAEAVGGLSAIAAVVMLARRVGRVEWRAALALLTGGVTACGVTAILSQPVDAAQLSVLDVGGGEAVLLQLPSGARALIDGGGDPSSLRTALGRALNPLDGHIDMVVLTAPDRTAAAGLGGLDSHYTVGEVALPVTPPAGLLPVLEGMRRGGTDVVVGVTTWRWGGVQWRCVAADPDRPAMGCVLRVAADTGWTAVILGVASSSAQEEIASLGPAVWRADVVVAPPAGSLAPVFLDVARPVWVAYPTATRRRTPDLGAGIVAATTASGGDLVYAAEGSHLVADP